MGDPVGAPLVGALFVELLVSGKDRAGLSADRQAQDLPLHYVTVAVYLSGVRFFFLCSYRIWSISTNNANPIGKYI